METNGVTTKPTHEVLAALDALDLECIKARMMDEELGNGWTRAYADAVASRYKRFLRLAVKYPEHAEELVIDRDVDEFWHAHILHTLKYAQDCHDVFGRFLHHTPHRRTGSQSEIAGRALAAQKTRLLYKLEFGADTEGSVREDQAYCGAAATPEKAYCGVAATPENAYCGIAAFDPKQAYCGVTASGIEHAYCGIAEAGEEAEASGLSAPTPQQAYCGLGAARSEDAYCGIAATANSDCGASIGRSRTRPSGQ